MRGKLLSFLCCIITIPYLIYYSSQFYMKGTISFDRSHMFIWSIVVIFIIIGVIGFAIVEKRLEEMTKILKDIQELQNLNHHENIKFQKGTRTFIAREIKMEEKNRK